MFDKEDIYNRIYALYVESEMTQAEFGRRIGVTGAAVQNYLVKKQVPKAYVIASICEAFEVSADWLLLGKKENGD